jgi:hypothetical protein
VLDSLDGWLALPVVAERNRVPHGKAYNAALAGALGDLRRIGGRLFVRVEAAEAWGRALHAHLAREQS